MHRHKTTVLQQSINHETKSREVDDDRYDEDQDETHKIALLKIQYTETETLLQLHLLVLDIVDALAFASFRYRIRNA